ncbi:unnamed protein product [Bathycoccus prasinos]
MPKTHSHHGWIICEEKEEEEEEEEGEKEEEEEEEEEKVRRQRASEPRRICFALDGTQKITRNSRSHLGQGLVKYCSRFEAFARRASASFEKSHRSPQSRIAGSKVKEPTVLDSIEQVSLEQYFSLWKHLKNSRKIWLMDGTPENLYYPISATRAHKLKALGVKVKAIAILRNPAERAYSEWSMSSRRCEKVKLADFFKKYDLHQTWVALQCRPYATLLKEEFSALHSLGCAQADTRTVEKYVRCFGKFVKCYSKRVNNTACSKHNRQVYGENRAWSKTPFFHSMGLLTKGNYEMHIKMWQASIGEENLLVINSTQLNNIQELEESVSKLLGETIKFKGIKKSVSNKGRYRKLGKAYKRGVSTWFKYSEII